ncbi:HNH endonuclease signature motif containing protein [Cellulomonas composti]|uniref:HNH nuclease domain-containing protein n=1 Tax=Cellulomonas composti TaxID=266130 RepID=A0A511J8L3_9CELL|nr:HNH endonuclease signature motif containing protein [Cellulomonas composti]GEL94063.1 hypothetical protein CCO02nite_07210 [Cellulomonas composti]
MSRFEAQSNDTAHGAGAPLRGGWERLTCADAVGLSEDDLLDALVAVQEDARRLEARRVVLVAEVAERSRRELGRESLARTHGCASGRELSQRLTGAAGASIGRWTRWGDALRPQHRLDGTPIPGPFDPVTEAFTAGRLDLDAAAAIIDVLRPTLRVAATEHVQIACTELVDAAAVPAGERVPALDADSVRIQATAWAAVLDPDGATPSDVQTARRFLSLSPGPGGLTRIRGLLLPEVAGALEAFADAATNPRTPEVPHPERDANDDGDSSDDSDGPAGCRQADSPDGDGPAADSRDTDSPAAHSRDTDSFAADGRDTGSRDTDGRADGGRAEGGADGDGPDADADRDELRSPGDERTRAQVLHDVFASAVMTAARVCEQRSIAGNSPTLLVAAHLDDLVHGTGGGMVLGGAGAGGVPGALRVDPAAVRQVACSGTVHKIILGAGGEIRGVGSTERCFTGAQRRAITLRDGGCVIPGCHIPASWCEVHHVIPHAEDPSGTHTDNGVLLCWYHHRTIETNGWQIRIRDGRPQVRAPGSLRRLSRPPGTRTDRGRPPSSRPFDASDELGWRPAIGSPLHFHHTLRARGTPTRR